jgi:hypothetical protein
LFGEHRYTIMATFIGAYFSCSMIMACMKVISRDTHVVYSLFQTFMCD